MIDSVWAELEQELEWRHQEIRLLSNSRNALKRETERDWFRRAQLVMLYAHAEGFCKISLLIYVRALNGLNLKRSVCSDSLVASSFEELFHALQFGDEKSKVFVGPLPGDPKLYVAARRRDLIAEFDSLMNQRLNLPESTVNTESNLSSIVLRRNLFRLGFPIDLMTEYDLHLDELVNRRNNIAHGIDDSVVRSTDYERLQRSVFQAMDSIALAIIAALDEASYMCTPGLRSGNEAWISGEMR